MSKSNAAVQALYVLMSLRKHGGKRTIIRSIILPGWCSVQGGRRYHFRGRDGKKVHMIDCFHAKARGLD
eukprot:1340400-Amorphochlora_amoeboformis.AAC.1